MFPDDEPPVGEPEGGFDGSSKGDGDASPEGGGDGSIEGGKDASTEGEEGEQSGAPDAGAAGMFSRENKFGNFRFICDATTTFPQEQFIFFIK